MKKHISLITTVAVILITAVVGYYMINLKKAPYAVANFTSFTYKWGVGDSLVNSYYSKTGNYQYLSNRDSLITTNVKLRPNDIIFIHNKINELGFWKLPDVIGKKNPDENTMVYEIEFNYKEKSKRMLIYSDYHDNPLLLDSAIAIKNILQKAIDDSESRYHQ